MVINIETTLIFTTLLYIVVIELSSLVSSKDLARRVDLENERYVLGWFPDLGTFTYIHVLNTFLLGFGYFVVFTNYLTNDSVPITLVLVLTASIFGLLPYLEIKQYDLIEKASDRRVGSRYAHLILWFWIILIQPILFLSIPYLGKNLGRMNAIAIVGGIFIVLSIALLIFFLKELEAELDVRKTQSTLKRFIDQEHGTD